MAIRPADLNVARTPIVAELTAASVWDMLTVYEQHAASTGTTALVAGATRLVREHVKQIIKLHDELKEDEILLNVTPVRPDGFQ